MPDFNDNIINNNINNVSRNSPLALVVGAAGFIGSHISDELIKKDVQVIGVDNFSTGKKENLNEATKSKKFHLININASELSINVPRLDYIFISAGSDWNLTNILNLAKKLNSKIVFVSKIEFYDRDVPEALTWYKNAESQIAKFAQNNKINARVVRLASVFGPRMHFFQKDPLIRLIQAALLDELQKESNTLEFSSRAIYISDAVDLIIKSMFSGSTAQKVFDGVNEPTKISELKQILMDPIWHETRRFVPSELPPWPTPNLEATKRHLFWTPRKNMVTALKDTLYYFKETETNVPELEIVKTSEFIPPVIGEEVGDEIKKKVNEWKQDVKLDFKKPPSKKRIFTGASLLLLTLWAIIIYGLFYPFLGILWNGYNFRENILKAEVNYSKGKVGKSLENVQNAKQNLSFINDIVTDLEPLLQLGVLTNKFETGRQYLNIYKYSLEGLQKAIIGSMTLYGGFKFISGEDENSFIDQIESATSLLESAYLGLTEVNLNIERGNIKNLPLINLEYYSKLTAQNKTLAKFLPQVTSINGSYIVLIEDNTNLIGSGGEILAVSRVDFENGKLKEIETKSAESIDKNITITTDPPQVLKNDLNIQKGSLKYSNFDADFPTTAKLTSWFYNKSTGKTVSGVIAIDITALEKLLEITGPVTVEEINKSIDSNNLNIELEKDTDNKLIVSLTNNLLSKIFFVSVINWPGIVNWFGESVESKNVQVYFENDRILAYLLSEGFSGSIPRPLKQQTDLVGFFETSIGVEKSNKNLDRRFNLDTSIDTKGNVSHVLRVNYISGSNTNLSNKLRVRLYIPAGSKITRASVGEVDLMKNSTSSIEYGRLVYSTSFEILPKEQKSLNIEYMSPNKLDLQLANINYQLDIIKQPGTLADSLEWRVHFPEILKTNSQTNIVTDLKSDRSFAVEFTK